MRPLIGFLTFFAFCSHARPQAQIFLLKSEKLKLKGDNYFYEDDSLQITFAFWAEKGAFNFKIQNKLNQPIYIDWFHTVLMAGAYKLDYFSQDTSADFRAFTYTGPVDNTWFGTGYGNDNVLPRVVHNERKTFLPAKTAYYSFNRRVFHILPIDYFTIPERCERSYEQPHSGRGKPVLVLSKSWSRRESPLTLKFFITICRDENLTQCRTLDFEFFLTQFFECPQEHFRGRLTSEGYTFPYRRQDSFYILYPEK
ncbi:MAG: hypothetical protein N2110_03890 [Flavobacteriales bacterium]|nr:hypothetical protein [Flavobacteriales bacterium]MCX7768151.1 hypothetical protein [Flavobacteriales bacterium]MDW8409557.1 hypothetical protein [Flavobacteriales bacterium]